jgi:hypothetical protein
MARTRGIVVHWIFKTTSPRFLCSPENRLDPKFCGIGSHFDGFKQIVH